MAKDEHPAVKAIEKADQETASSKASKTLSNEKGSDELSERKEHFSYRLSGNGTDVKLGITDGKGVEHKMSVLDLISRLSEADRKNLLEQASKRVQSKMASQAQERQQTLPQPEKKPDRERDR